MAESQHNLKIVEKNWQKQNEMPIKQNIQFRQIYHGHQQEIEPTRPNQSKPPTNLVSKIQLLNEKEQIDRIKSNPQIQNLNPQSATKIQQNITIQEVQPIFYSFPSIEQKRELKIQCQFCAQFLAQGNFQRAFSCSHLYCKNCLNTYFQIQLKNYKVILCPEQSCKAPVEQNSNHYKNLIQPQKQKYSVIKFRKSIELNPNLALCPDEKCTRGYMQVKPGDKTGQCKQCRVVYCLNCKIKNHSGKCQNYQEILLKDKFKYKRCFGCKSVVERNQGCPHMTCKCGSQFCYYCGKKWDSPHRCLRYLAGGPLITDKLYTGLKCLRHEDFEYEYTVQGFLMKIPYYLVFILILTVYISWCLLVLVLMITLVLIGSCIPGYFAIQYKLCQGGTRIGRVIFVLFIILIPIGFIVGWFGIFGAIVISLFPKYLELALSARLFPCAFLC